MGNFSGWFELHVRRLGLASIPAKVLAAERLGHANIRITLQTYSHVSPGMQEDAAAKVAALIPRGRDDPR